MGYSRRDDNVLFKVLGFVVLVAVIFGGVYWFHTNYRCTSTHVEQHTDCDSRVTSSGRRVTEHCRTYPVDVCDNWESR